MKKKKKKKGSKKATVGKKSTGKVLCPCYGCEKPIAVLYGKNNEPTGLAHGALVGNEFGPNGETGCKAFDELGDTADEMTAFLVKCREAHQGLN